MNYEPLRTIDGSVPQHTITLNINQINHIIGFCELYQCGACASPGGTKEYNDAVTKSIMDELGKVFSVGADDDFDFDFDDDPADFDEDGVSLLYRDL